MLLKADVSGAQRPTKMSSNHLDDDILLTLEVEYRHARAIFPVDPKILAGLMIASVGNLCAELIITSRQNRLHERLGHAPILFAIFYRPPGLFNWLPSITFHLSRDFLL